MISQLKSDFKYCWFSKLLPGMLLLFLLTTFLTFYLNYREIDREVFAFQNQLEIYQKSGDDINAALQENYEIVSEPHGNVGAVISNPISYHYQLLNKVLCTLTSDYTFSLLCEGGLLFFPILCSFFGLIWVTSDFKYKTLRYRSLRLGNQKSFFIKQMSGFVILLFLFLLVIFASFIIQTILRNMVLNNRYIDFSIFSFSPQISYNVFKQFLFTVWIIFFYYEFGFTFGNLTKGNPVGIVIVSIYVLLIPPFFKYDIANIFNNFSKETFAFLGAYHLQPLKKVPLIYGGIELICILLMFLFCNTIISKKRSAYV